MNDDEGFKQAKEIVDHIMVVNDTAERAVQLGSNLRDTVRCILNLEC